MNELANELINEILLLGEAGKKPAAKKRALKPGESSEHPGYYHRGAGYYSNVNKDGPVTHKTDDAGNMVRLSPEEKAAKNKELQAHSEPKGVGSAGVDTKQGTVQQPQSIQPKQDLEPRTQSLRIGGGDELRANDVVGGIFSESSTIELGPDKVKTEVRHIVDPSTGEIVDVSTPEGREKGVQILNDRLEQFRADGTIERVLTALQSSDTPTGERTALRKWLGNLGEIGGLRDFLAAGHEAYLYSDSNPKNDIITLINCSDDSETTRDIRVVAISTKTTSGKKVGRIDASALVYIMDSVAGKMVKLRGKGRDFRFRAENIAQALFGMQKRIYSTSTRGDVKKGVRKGQRKIEVDSDRRQYYDSDTLAKAENQSTASKSARDPGGQRLLISARKITPEEVAQWFHDEQSPVYQRLLADMGKVMDGNVEAAKILIGLLFSRLQHRIQHSTDFRLSDFDTWMTDEISGILDEPHQETDKPSELVFQSDMMISTFDIDKGYVGCKMVEGDIMSERVREKYGDTQDMTTTDKLKRILGWTMNPRGVGLGTKEGGYVDPQQRATPPLNLLRHEDFVTIPKFTENACK